MQHIQGEERNQLKMFCLEHMVEENSFVRVIDSFVESIDLASFGFRHVKVKEEGRPPYNPAILLKLYFYGYRYGVRSSRKLEREAKLNIEVRWLLCEQTPSARTICSFRKEYASSFRAIFRCFVYELKEMGFIEGKTIAIDSFKVRAQNSLKNNYNEKKITRQLEYIDGRIKEFEEAMDEADTKEEKAELCQKIETQKSRREKYQAIRKEIEETGKEQVSTTDKDAQSVILQRGITVVGYNIQAAVDAKNKLIVHFDTGSVNDTNALSKVAIATKEVLQVEKMDVLADKGYHTGKEIEKCEEKGIITYVSPKEPASNDPDIYPVASFIYNEEKNSYKCPAGETLTTNGKWYTHSSRGYKSAYKFQRYNTDKCKSCVERIKCTKSKINGRSIDRSEFATQMEGNNKRVKEKPDYYRKRQELAEHPWGTLKRQRNFEYVLTRGKRNVLGEVSLEFIVYNLSRLMRIAGGICALKKFINGLILIFLYRNRAILLRNGLVEESGINNNIFIKAFGTLR